jgi:hypothetical protein
MKYETILPPIKWSINIETTPEWFRPKEDGACTLINFILHLSNFRLFAP